MVDGEEYNGSSLTWDEGFFWLLDERLTQYGGSMVRNVEVAIGKRCDAVRRIKIGGLDVL